MLFRSHELGYFGNIWVRQNFLKTSGDSAPGHYHHFDHVSLLASGKVLVEVEGCEPKEFTAPTFIVIKKEHKHKLCVNPRTIRRILEELHINEEDEVIITGDFGDWGWFCNFLLSQVIEGDFESED